MPAKSEKQQVAARIAHAIKKGKVKPKKGTASAQMAKGMSDKQIKHFMVREGDEPIDEKATSQKQRAFLNARFGHAWVKRHHFGQKGELPTYAHGGKTTSPEVKAAFNKKKKKKEKTEETTTTVNIGPGPSTVPTRPRPRPKPATSVSPGLKKKKKEPPLRAVRSYTGREMAVARDRVMQMVTEFEADRDRRRRLRENLIDRKTKTGYTVSLLRGPEGFGVRVMSPRGEEATAKYRIPSQADAHQEFEKLVAFYSR